MFIAHPKLCIDEGEDLGLGCALLNMFDIDAPLPIANCDCYDR